MEQEEIIDGEGPLDEMESLKRERSEIPSPPRSPVSLPNVPRRTKRPRMLTAGITSEPATLAVPTIGSRKRLKPPALEFPNSASNVKVCAFCSVPGTQRECEGRLLGPFRFATGGKAIYAHRNCCVWAPEVWEADKTGKLNGVQKAYVRSRRAKCCLCGTTGASLSCMFKRTACCRPMHFRCALLGGASLREGFQTFCPNHSNRSEFGVGPPPGMELFHERTPVERHLVMPGSGCTLCNEDSYNTHYGSILTCSNCFTRHHTKCMWPGIERDGVFSALSWQRRYLCKECMTCVHCDNPIDKYVYSINEKSTFTVQHEAFDAFGSASQEPECDTLKCLGCGHFASHIACLPEGSKPESWRCDLCLLCKHCGAVNVPRNEWDEAAQACLICFNEIRKGGVVCPVCLKVYREGENIPMVQCDDCDKWVHALGCGGLTMERFKALDAPEAKYRCPICIKEKKARDLERRRSKNGTGTYQVNGLGPARTNGPINLELILKRIQGKDNDDECGVSFHYVRKAAVESDSLDSVFDNLSPNVDLCRVCCSTGDEQSLLFCSDCGECYHQYCYESGAATQLAKPKVTPAGAADAVNDSNKESLPGGRTYEDLWCCSKCMRVKRLSQGAKEEEMPALPFSRYVKNGKKSKLRKKDAAVNSDAAGQHDADCSAPGNGGAASDIAVWKDCRECEFCAGGENPKAIEGRLVPWASITNSDLPHCWFHTGCLLWSVGISIHGKGKSYDVLMGPRRSLLHFAKTNQCEHCEENGATLRCSSKGCTGTFHFHCAITAGVACILKFEDEEKGRAILTDLDRESGCIRLADLEQLRLLCPDHAAVERSSRQVMISLTEAQSLLDLQRGIRVFDVQGFSVDAEPPKKKPLSPDRLLSIRVGALSVLQFGRLVPEVNDFIVDRQLIPLGYIAARRFWSILHPWKRCLYFFEICGFPQSGPTFVIRCTDCASARFSSKDPDIAWSTVVEKVNEARRLGGFSRIASHLTVNMKGLEAFGLANCIPVVTHVESLPMASMFAERYRMIRLATHRSDEVVFYNSLAKKFAPVTIKENRSGSARSEGYASATWLQKKHKKSKGEVPSYENARTGAAFQLQVAREVFSRYENLHPSNALDERGKLDRGYLDGSRATSYAEDEERSRANKSTPSLPTVTQHRTIASTSKDRTVILRSNIDGCGVFATKDIPPGEMIIEYVGEIIRPVLSDIREGKYLERGIGCYMFQIEPGLIVDATMCGNAARYINHSCAPNCYSKTITLENDRKVVVIFAKRRIQRGEELSYDYQFPLDDADRVKCGCGTEQCKGWMN